MTEELKASQTKIACLEMFQRKQLIQTILQQCAVQAKPKAEVTDLVPFMEI